MQARTHHDSNLACIARPIGIEVVAGDDRQFSKFSASCPHISPAVRITGGSGIGSNSYAAGLLLVDLNLFVHE